MNQSLSRKKPRAMKSKAWLALEASVRKLPPPRILPYDKADKKNAKLMQALLDYEWGKIEPKVLEETRKMYRTPWSDVTHIWWDKSKRWWEFWK